MPKWPLVGGAWVSVITVWRTSPLGTYSLGCISLPGVYQTRPLFSMKSGICPSDAAIAILTYSGSSSASC
eukprot:1056256-Pelagomonas_calceolata.AAC.1